jgi:hypothetical protein
MTMPAVPVPPTFDPGHANFEAFTGTSSKPTPRAVFPPRMKIVVAAIIAVAVLLCVLILVTAPQLALFLLPGIGFVTLILLFGVLFAIQIKTSITGSPGDAAKQAVLTQFAADNGLLYRTRSRGPSYPGCIFASMNTRLPYVYDHLSTIRGRYLDFGNFHSYSTTGDGPGSHLDPDPLLNSWGFIALQMDQQLPNILLISKRRVGGQTVLPIQPDPSQILSLEGNFDQYFTLYCPKEFEQDALYVFTPDLMALLIDEAAPFDVEIVDRWMFFYVPRPFNSMDPQVYQRLFRILQTVGTKIVGQTSNYSNPELAPMATTPAAPVADWHFTWNPALFGSDSPPGTRLKLKPQLVRMIVIVGLVLLVFLAIIVYGTVTGRGHFG